MPTQPQRPIAHDPVFYLLLCLFALLTTTVGVMLGSAWLLALLQMVALWLFALAAFRRRSVRDGVLILACWSIAQGATFFVLTLAFGARVEAAVGEGFFYREALLEWFYTGAGLPATWAAQPWARAVELAGVTLGALFTAGLLGIWFLVRMVGLYAFGAAAMWQSTSTLTGLAGGLAPWMLLRIAGSIGSIAVLSLVAFTGEWSPGRWPPNHRRALWISLALLAVSVVLELLLPGPWSTWLGVMSSG